MDSPPPDPFTFTDFLSHPVFIAIGVLASIVSVAWVVWIVLGAIATRPRVRIEPGYGTAKGDHRALYLRFFNDQLASWPFNMLNIKRQNIDEFWTLMDLVRASGEYVFGLWVPLHDRKGSHDETHALPASIHPLEGIAAVVEDGLVYVMGEHNDGVMRTVLEPDTYEVRMFIHADEVDVRSMAQRFVVTLNHAEEAYDAQWVGAPYQLKSPRRPPKLIRRLLAFRTGGFPTE